VVPWNRAWFPGYDDGILSLDINNSEKMAEGHMPFGQSSSASAQGDQSGQ
jgi:hypothetical protein